MAHVRILASPHLLQSFCQWKNCNSTNQHRLELIYKTFQDFDTGKFAIQQFNGEWRKLDFPLSVLLQVLKAFAIEYLVIQQINSV